MIYFDNAATTKPTKECLEIFNKINAEKYFNPSASYSASFSLHNEINDVRQQFIKYLGGESNDKIIFTSGATEANNLAIFGSALNKQKKYLFSIGEHPSVYNCACDLKNRGYNVDFISLNKNGQIDYEELEYLCNDEVCFLSIMLVNNETGAINDINRIRQIIDKKSPNCVLHIDAVQGFGKIKFSVLNYKIDLCSISAHKIGGIKGIGALYISSKTKLKNINYGGNQEFTLRSGTVNSASIFSFLTSTQQAFSKLENNYNVVSELKRYLIEKLNNLNEEILSLKNINKKIIVVSKDECSPYVNSVIFKGNRGETIMHYLDSKDIYVGTGSACSSNKVGNRVLENIGYSKNEVMGAIRISFNPNNTNKEIDSLIAEIKEYLLTINT